MTRQTLHDELLKRLKEKRRFLQVLAGPRQVGKTTIAHSTRLDREPGRAV
jgi:predicted AAA+ superfamily ATPase